MDYFSQYAVSMVENSVVFSTKITIRLFRAVDDDHNISEGGGEVFRYGGTGGSNSLLCQNLYFRLSETIATENQLYLKMVAPSLNN